MTRARTSAGSEVGVDPSVSLIFGGSRGIGAAVARRLASFGPVVLTHHRHADEGEQLARELSGEGHVALAVPCDATVADDVADAYSAAEELGHVERVVFCVGGWTYPRVEDLTADTIRAELDLNLVSALLVLQGAATRVADQGRVVLLSSAAAAVAPSRQAVYTAAKAGLEAAGRVAAKEFARRGVTVNVVRPGATDTETLRFGTSEKAIEAMSASNAMRRLGTPDDIAGAVSALVSDDAGWITGAVVDATGGLY